MFRYHILLLILVVGIRYFYHLPFDVRDKCVGNTNVVASPDFAHYFNSSLLEDERQLNVSLRFGIYPESPIKATQSMLRYRHRTLKDILILFQAHDKGFIDTTRYKEDLNLLRDNIVDPINQNSTTEKEILHIFDVLEKLDMKDLHDKKQYVGIIYTEEDYVYALLIQYRLLETKLFDVWTYEYLYCKFVDMKS